MKIQPYNPAHERDLNLLFNGLGVTNPNVIKLSDLIHTYGPKTYNELGSLINQYSKMSLGQIAKKCFDNQHLYQLSSSYTIEDMVAYTWSLFVVKTLDGFNKEEKAQTYLTGVLEEDGLRVGSHEFFDINYAVDIYVGFDKTLFAGIQVKPESYKYVTNNIKKGNVARNNAFTTKYSAPVLYLYYDKNGRFVNMKEVLENVRKYSHIKVG